MGNANSGRRPGRIPAVKWNLHIPSDLATEIELILLDPMTGQARYGSRAALVEGLLRDWVAKMRKIQLTSGDEPAMLGAVNTLKD